MEEEAAEKTKGKWEKKIWSEKRDRERERDFSFSLSFFFCFFFFLKILFCFSLFLFYDLSYRCGVCNGLYKRSLVSVLTVTWRLLVFKRNWWAGKRLLIYVGSDGCKASDLLALFCLVAFIYLIILHEIIF